jgi:splicing factor 3A subunit 1
MKISKKWSKNVIFSCFIFLILAVKTTRPPAPDELLISPLTGEKIPATKVQEHMRIGLLDPRWVEQRDRQIQDKINQETVYAPGRVLNVMLQSV